MTYEVIEKNGTFLIISGDEESDEIVFESINGAEIHKWIIDHEGTYYIRSTKWQDDLVNVKEPKS